MKSTKTVRASQNVRPARRISASRASLQRRAIKADDELDDIPAPADEDLPAPADVDAPVDEEPEVIVDDEAAELLFEAEDVAQLIAEVTELPVEVTVDDEEVKFAIGNDEYTVTAEGDEEVVEQSTRVRKSAKTVRAGRQMMTRRSAPARRVSASRATEASRRAVAARRVAATRRVSAARRPATQK